MILFLFYSINLLFIWPPDRAFSVLANEQLISLLTADFHFLRLSSHRTNAAPLCDWKPMTRSMNIILYCLSSQMKVIFCWFDSRLVWWKQKKQKQLIFSMNNIIFNNESLISSDFALIFFSIHSFMDLNRRRWEIFLTYNDWSRLYLCRSLISFLFLNIWLFVHI